MKKRKKRNPENNIRLEFYGTILILFTAIISGISIVVNRFFVVSIDPLLFTAVRAFFIGIIFFIISFYFSKTNKKPFKKTSWKNLLLIALIGGSFAFWLFFTGLKLATAGRAAFLHKTLPLYAAIFGYFILKEKITKEQLFSMIIMVIGLAVLEISAFTPSIRIGDTLIIIATILWAFENTLSKKVMLEKESNWVVTFSRMFFGSLILFAIIFLSGKYDLLFSLNSQQILYILISGIFLLLYVFSWYWGLRYINLSKASTILLIAPVISLFLGIFWLNERVILLQLIGSAMILVGAYFIFQIKSEHRIK